MVEQRLGDGLAVEVLQGDRTHRLVHGLVVVRGRDDEVAAFHQVVVADFVLVDQRAARRLDDADAAALALARGLQRAAEDGGVVQQLRDHLHAVQQLDHARPVRGQHRVHRPAAVRGHEGLAPRFGARGRDVVAVLQPRQRADTVPAGLGAERAAVGELHVGPGLDRLVDQLAVALVLETVHREAAVGLAQAQRAVVQLHGAAGADEGHHGRGRFAEVFVRGRQAGVQPLGQVHRGLGPGQHLGQLGAQGVAVLARDGAVHAAGHRARAVHPLAGRDADHLLAELAQHHALARGLGVGHRDADDVALRDVGVEAEQQVGRGQVEEVQRVALHDLAVVHQAADAVGRLGHRPAADHAVQRLGRGQVVRDRADAAQALHHHRHLPVGPADDELLEAAELDDVQPHLLQALLLVQQQRDLAVAFHARDRVDHDAAQALRVGGGFQRTDGISHSGSGPFAVAVRARPSGPAAAARRRRPAAGSRAGRGRSAPPRGWAARG